MRIIQVLVTLSYGDGVGNDAVAIDKILKDAGYDTKIYAENIDARISRHIVENIKNISQLYEEDVVIYHLSTGCDLNLEVMKWKCKKIFRYHNVTPPEFFEDYNKVAYNLCDMGVQQVQHLKDTPDYVIADSEFNKRDLQKMGYTCPIAVVPILIPFEDYEIETDKKIIKQYEDGWTNIIFVGRVVPNKKHEDLIKQFSYYKKYINPMSRLILVGSYDKSDEYYRSLLCYIELIDVEDVIFTGHVKFHEILAYYKVGSLFLCMSEHEGFCIPIVEAMYFHLPIVAFSSTAVPYTMGQLGAIVDSKNPVIISKVINIILKNSDLKDKLVNDQDVVLEGYAYESVKKQFVDCLSEFCEGMCL